MDKFKAFWSGVNTNVKSLIIGTAGVLVARALVASGVIESAAAHDMIAVAAGSIAAAFQRTFASNSDED